MIASTQGFLQDTEVGGASIVGQIGRIDTTTNSGTGTRSSDGLTWSNINLASGAYAIAAGSGTFVAIVNNEGTLNTNGASYSVDGGQTWVAVTGLTGQWTDAAYSPTLNRFVCVRPNDQTPRANYVAFNNGGRGNWASATGPTGVGTGTFMAVKWGNDRFVAVGRDLNASIHSTTGTGTWTAGGSFPATYPKLWHDLAYSPTLGIWVAVGVTANDKTVISSSNGGVSWTGRTGPTAGTNGYDCVDWSPTLGLFLAAGQGLTNKFMTSTNGTSWTALTTASGTAAGGFVALNWSDELGAFLGSNSSGTWRSSDGVNWEKVNTVYVSKYASLPYNPDAENFINAAGITGTNATAINTLVLDLKRADLWDKMVAVYPFIGDTASTQKWNLKNPQDTDAAFRLTFYGGWTHSGTGAFSNGTNAYANTFIIPTAVAGSTANRHLSYCLTTSNTGAQQPSADPTHFGSYVDTANNELLNSAAFGTNQLLRIGGNTGEVSVTNPGRPAMFVGTRIGNEQKLFNNGDLQGTGAPTGAIPNNRNVLIANVSIGSTAEAYNLGYSKENWTFVSYGQGLTDTESVNLTNIVIKYKTAIGR